SSARRSSHRLSAGATRDSRESSGPSTRSTTRPTRPASRGSPNPQVDRASLASVEITRTTPLFPSAVFVQWVIVADESGPHLVDLARAGARNGPWEPVAQSLADAYHYLDKSFNLPPPPRARDHREGLHFFSLSRDVYYQVTVTPPSGRSHAFASAPTPIEP